MAQPHFNGIVVAHNFGGVKDAPVADNGMEFSGETVIRHASGAYIRFSAEGDIFIVPAPNRQAVIGDDLELA